MKVSELMKRFPRTINADEELSAARELMVFSGIRHLPVLRDGKLVGILSQRDVLAHQVAAGERGLDGLVDPVEAAMQPNPQTCASTDSLTEVSGRLALSKIGCFPVTEKGELVGLITVSDVLAATVQRAMEPIGRGPTVAEVMTRDPVVVSAGDHLLDAAARMQQHGIRHLPVVDVDGVGIGMLSDRDIRTAIGSPARAFEGGLSPAVQVLRVWDTMSRPGISVSPDERCVDVAGYFTDLAVSAVAVADDGGKVIGMLSYIDLLRALA